MGALAVLVVWATWSVAEDTLEKGDWPASMLLILLSPLLRSQFQPVRCTALIYGFCYFVVLATWFVREECCGW